MKQCLNYQCKHYDDKKSDNCFYGYLLGSLDECFFIRNFPQMAGEEKINWLKTGWVKNKKTNSKIMITTYNESMHNPYYLSGIGWCTEGHLIKYYEPCKSPIGE
jgi:hypothetical protein